MVADDHLDTQRLGACLYDLDRLRMASLGDEERASLRPPRRARAHVHRLGGRGGFVEQRRVRDRQAGQVDHHRLEVEQRLESALGDLRLVRRVLRVPARVLQDVAQDHGGVMQS